MGGSGMVDATGLLGSKEFVLMSSLMMYVAYYAVSYVVYYFVHYIVSYAFEGQSAGDIS
jgi:hypothetical protein